MRRRDITAAGLAVAAILIGLLSLGWAQPPVVYDVGSTPSVRAASTGGTSFTVDPSRAYALYHTGKTIAGAEATALIAIGYEAAPTTADYSAESNKLILEAGGTVLIDRGPGTIYLKSLSGAPTVQIVPRASALTR